MSALHGVRLVLRGAGRARGVSALLAILVLCATMLAVGAPRAVEQTLTHAVRADLASVGTGRIALDAFLNDEIYSADGTSTTVAPVWSGLPSRLDAIHRALTRVGDLAGVVGHGAFLGEATGDGGQGVPGSGTPTSASNALFRFIVAAAPGLRGQARLVSGRWPGPVREGAPVDVVLSASSAATLHWRIGQTQVLNLPAPRTMVLVGTVAPRHPTDAFWDLDPHRAAAGAQPSPDGTFVTYVSTVFVDPGSWPSLAPSLPGHQIEAWFPVDAAAIDAPHVASIAAQLRRFAVQPVPLGIGDTDQLIAFRSDLPSELAAFEARSAPSTEMIALFALGPAGVFAAVLLLALRLLQRRRSVAATLMRSRGGAEWQARLLALGEVLLWTAPAAVIGAVGGVLSTSDSGSPVPSVPAAVLCLLAAPTAAAVLAGTGDGAPLGPRAAVPVRLAAEGAAVLVAALALVVLLTRGPVSSGAAADPLLLGTPVLLAIAITVLVVRLSPVASARLARLERAHGGAIGLVAASGSSRSGVAALALFALVVGVGMSVFSLTLVSTQQHGIQQAALTRAGSDVAVSSARLSGGQVRALESMPGVAAHATISVLGQQRVGSNPVTLYGVDVAELRAVQREIDRPALSGISQDSALVAGLDDHPPTSLPLDAPGRSTLRLRQVDPDVVTRVLSEPQWVLLDQRELPASDPLVVGVLLRLHSDADPAAVARAAARAAPGATVTTAAGLEKAFLGTPLDSAVRTAISAATGISGLLVLVVFAVLLAAETAERLRRGAILRALGFDRRESAALILLAIAPIALAGTLAGTVTGVVLAAVVLRSLDPAGFVGSPATPALVVDPVVTLLAGLSFLAAAAIAGAVAIVFDRSRPVTAGLQTLGEER